MSMKNTISDIISAKNPETHTLSTEHVVSDAVEKMKNRNIGALVILNDDDKVVGIFSERDLLNRVIAHDLDPKTTKISEVMTPEPICIGLSLTVEEAMSSVTKNNIRHLPIVSEGILAGLVSSRDLTAWVVNTQKTELQSLSNKLISIVLMNRALIAVSIIVFVLSIIAVWVT